MIIKPKILDFIAKQGRSVSFRDLMREFGLSEGAACDHLKCLWRDRLIGPDKSRPRGFEFRLMEGERITYLCFYLTPRGETRLHWYRVHGWRGRIRGYF